MTNLENQEEAAKVINEVWNRTEEIVGAVRAFAQRQPIDPDKFVGVSRRCMFSGYLLALEHMVNLIEATVEAGDPIPIEGLLAMVKAMYQSGSEFVSSDILTSIAKNYPAGES